MIYHFDDYELDGGKVELRCRGVPVAVEPQVFALIHLLVENRDRMVSKDEIIEKIWDGRIVSESAVTSRVKSARKALGDDGKRQAFIKTVHGQGFRFVAEARAASPLVLTPASAAPSDAQNPARTKPSIAVLPFRLVGVAGPHAPIADALPDELISALSRLRWLFVIARGSSFRFRDADPDVAGVGRALNVRYCLSGVVEVAGDRIAVTVELADTRDGAAVWGERYAAKIDDIHNIREEIVSRVVSALEIQITMNEAMAARLKPPEQLDAWSAYHLGVQHLHRFNKKDNGAAQGMFERAVALDPAFARAHAGLSSAHFQNAFLKYTGDLAGDVASARRYAERAVEIDPLDPYVNYVMGRAHWIENDLAGGAGWFDRSVSLSPNFAQGVYVKGFANAVRGRSEEGRRNIDLALQLSPLDPFRYAMLGVHAFILVAEGDYAAAAGWAEDAARAPGAHVLIAAIAAACHELNGDHEKAKAWAANVRERKPDLTQEDYFRAFPFENATTRERFSKALAVHGF